MFDFGIETLIYAGFDATSGTEVSFSVFGMPKAKVEAILGFVGICSLLTRRVSNVGPVCEGDWKVWET